MLVSCFDLYFTIIRVLEDPFWLCYFLLLLLLLIIIIIIIILSSLSVSLPLPLSPALEKSVHATASKSG